MLGCNNREISQCLSVKKSHQYNFCSFPPWPSQLQAELYLYFYLQNCFVVREPITAEMTTDLDHRCWSARGGCWHCGHPCKHCGVWHPFWAMDTQLYHIPPAYTYHHSCLPPPSSLSPRSSASAGFAYPLWDDGCFNCERGLYSIQALKVLCKNSSPLPDRQSDAQK